MKIPNDVDSASLEKYGDAIYKVIVASPKFKDEVKEIAHSFIENKLQDVAHATVDNAIRQLGIEFNEDDEGMEVRMEFEMNIFFQLQRTLTEEIIEAMRSY